MVLPEHWWILALAVIGQTVFFAGFAFSRGRGAPGWALACLALGAACGLVYAWLRRDAVLAAGQAGILLLAWIGFGTRDR